MIGGIVSLVLVVAALGFGLWDALGRPWPAHPAQEARRSRGAAYWRVIYHGTKRGCQEALRAAQAAGKRAALGRIGDEWAALIYT